MKIFLLSSFVLIFSLAAFSQSEAPVNWGIYLTRLPESEFRTLDPIRVNLDSVPLESKPLISEKDIVEYRRPSHIIKLTPEGFGKISRIRFSNGSDRIPFVVVVQGRKIYMGMIWSGFSSEFRTFPYISDFAFYNLSDESVDCSTCIQIRPPRVDGRDISSWYLQHVGLIKDDLNPAERPAR